MIKGTIASEADAKMKRSVVVIRLIQQHVAHLRIAALGEDPTQKYDPDYFVPQ
jgi:hypothetical protein